MTLEYILQEVCRLREVTVHEVMGPSRKEYLTDTRHIYVGVALALGWEDSTMIMAAIGRGRSSFFNSQNIAMWQLSDEVTYITSQVFYGKILGHLSKRRQQRKKVAEVFAK